MKKILFFTILGLLLAAANSKAQGIKIMPGTTFTLTGGDYYIVLQDGAHFENDAAVQSSNLILKAAGTGNSEIKGSAALGIGSLDVNVDPGQSILLQKDIDIQNGINFTSGLFDLNNHNAVLASTALLAGENENSRTVGSLGGSIQITQDLNAPLAENPGNLGMVITSGANWGSTLIKRSHMIQTSSNGGTSIARSFDILPSTNTGLSAFLRMYYYDAELNSIDENLLDFFQSNNNSTTWNNIGSVSRNTIQNFVNMNGIQNMSLFTLSSNINPLPLSLTFISITCTDKRPQLQWRVANPQDVLLFKIERSADASKWQSLDTQIPLNPSPEHEYQFTDMSGSYSYYRLQMVEKNGAVFSSPVQKANCANGSNTFTLLQNPVDRDVRINIHASLDLRGSAVIYDMQGKLLITAPLAVSAGDAELSYDVSGLASGMYQIYIKEQNAMLWQTRFVKY
jgi:hypothetical protein